jgi:2-oxoglutarate/2-oxoacid ferredoxin oxidoreductase subunit beta
MRVHVKAEVDVAERPTWCMGCGDFMILDALKSLLVAAQVNTDDVYLVSGIGCSSKVPHWINVSGIHSIHGRALPLAMGLKLANSRLHVIVLGGDGDAYGIGGGHLLHMMRRNITLTYIVHNNQVYGLTKGQYSPTSEQGVKTPTTLFGAPEVSLNPLAMAIAGGATFVARTFAGDAKHMLATLLAAFSHKGFALVDVLQPCVTYNHVNTYQYFQKRCYAMTDHDPLDKVKAFARAQEWGDRIPLGIFYTESRPTLESQLPQIAHTPLVEQPITDIDLTPLFNELM